MTVRPPDAALLTIGRVDLYLTLSRMLRGSRLKCADWGECSWA